MCLVFKGPIQTREDNLYIHVNVMTSGGIFRVNKYLIFKLGYDLCTELTVYYTFGFSPISSAFFSQLDPCSSVV